MNHKSQNKYAGALLVTPEGSLIMQQRDNKPGIMNPGQVTTFGGAVEDNEHPDAAIVRELFEELGLVIDNPKLYKLFHKTLATHGEDRDMYIYIVQDINPKQLHVKEGLGYVLIDSDSDLEAINLTVLAKEVLTDYWSSTL